MDRKYILAMDQGTTGTRVILFDNNGQIVSNAYCENRQFFPQPGWVEHDPVEILEGCIRLSEEAVCKAGIPFSSIQGIGIANLRESVVVWNLLPVNLYIPQSAGNAAGRQDYVSI